MNKIPVYINFSDNCCPNKTQLKTYWATGCAAVVQSIFKHISPKKQASPVPTMFRITLLFLVSIVHLSAIFFSAKNCTTPQNLQISTLIHAEEEIDSSQFSILQKGKLLQDYRSSISLRSSNRGKLEGIKGTQR